MLDDTAPDSTNPRDFALRLAEAARQKGLDVPIYTTSANFFMPDVEKEIRRWRKTLISPPRRGIPPAAA